MAPRQLCSINSLHLACLDQSDMVGGNNNPGDEHTARREIQKPPENIQSTVRYTHVCEAGKERLEENCHIRDSISGGLEEDLGCLALQCQAIENSCSAEK